MKLISWNVNGFRAILKKGFAEIFAQLDADIFCIQETKMQPGQAEFSPEGYEQYWYSAEKKGYAGTAVFTRIPPLSVRRGTGAEEHSHEGRTLTLEFEHFFLVTAYVPNSQNELARLPYRLRWEEDMRAYLQTLQAQKPVVYCGDFNVAHEDIDLKNPEQNRGTPGFSSEERACFSSLLRENGLLDTFRALHPTETGAYTWWSYLRNGRATNAGWRIDYFLISLMLGKSLQSAFICSDVLGSDHCPVGITLE